ncbi:MAG: hypothetical protein LBI69_04120 [Puniceicoccales bacterium]|jgi:hypothetical protein|nr:hypothetical protein [Puniceicoccales bacterium]
MTDTRSLLNSTDCSPIQSFTDPESGENLQNASAAVENPPIQCDILKSWVDPRTIDSPLQDAWDVVRSIFLTLCGIGKEIFFKIFQFFRRTGDNVTITPTETLLNSPETREIFFRNIRLATNHLQILAAEYQRLSLPLGTDNFIRWTGSDDIHEQSRLNLALPKNFPATGDPRRTIKARLKVLNDLLVEKGFVAFKEGKIILHLHSHFACAFLYDDALKKICIHMRDTASDRFWEAGSSVNWLANFKQQMGIIPDVYAMGDLFVHCCAEVLGRDNLLITGYSMGGGIAFFSGVRNRVPAIGFNPAFLSKYHNQCFPDGWEEWVKENISSLSTSNDILSQCIDNPRTGGISPTCLPEGITVYLTQSARSRWGKIFDSLRGHYLSEITYGMLHELYAGGKENRLDFYRIYNTLPAHIQDAYQSKYSMEIQETNENAYNDAKIELLSDYREVNCAA